MSDHRDENPEVWSRRGHLGGRGGVGRGLLICLGLFGGEAQGAPALPPPDPTLWLLTPQDGEVVPTNVKPRFNATEGSVPEDFRLTLYQENAEPLELQVSRAACGEHPGCELSAEMPELVDEEPAELHILQPKGWEDVYRFLPSGGPDHEAPWVESPAVSELSYGASNEGEGGERVLKRSVRFERPFISDDHLVEGWGLYRGLPGEPPALVHYDSGASTVISDSLTEDEASGEVCYSFRAWDLSSNEGASAPTCVDVAFTDEEREWFESLPPETGVGCSQTNARGGDASPLTGGLALLGLVVGGAGRRRRRAG